MNIQHGQKRINEESRGRKEINLCLAALLNDQRMPIREWSCQDIDQVLLHGSCFVCSVSSSSEVTGQSSSSSILSKLPPTACWFRKNVSEECFGRMWDK